MTTARSDMATGRYNDPLTSAEATEFRPLDTSGLDKLNDVDDPLRVSAPRRNKTVASTAQGLRAGLLRRGVGLTSRKGNTTGRTPRTGRQKGERPSWA